MAISIAKSAKRIQIDKTNGNIVLMVSLAAVVAAFSIVAIKDLLVQQSYQARVISQQNTALKVAKADVTAAQALSASYKAFNGVPNNIIGGLTAGTGAQDGNNSKVILDSLPSQYDFPALISSVEGLLKSRGFKIDSLAGADDVTQSGAATVAIPQPVAIPFQIGVTGSYASVQDLIGVFDHSVRPISIDTLQLSGGESAISLQVSAKTYFQPGKVLTVTTKVVK
jgi:hypothetical protein